MQFIGNNNILSMSIGDSNVSSFYMGDKKVWSEKEPGPTPGVLPVPYFSVEHKGSYGILNGFSALGSYAYNNGEITDLVLPSSYSLDGNNNIIEGNDYLIIKIGYHAFQNCANLISATMPSSLENILFGAFDNCTGLTSVVLSNNVTTIEDMSFYNCSSLTFINIPDSIIDIEGNPFNGCYNLSYYTYDNAYYLGNDTNNYVVLMKPLTYDIANCQVNQNCKIIYHLAFNACPNITSITIPNSVTSIGSSAFSYCDNLTSITIGSGVTSIGYQAFRNCTGLTSFTINAEVPPIIGSDLFYFSPSSMIIYVPAQSVSAYQTAWAQYASRIQAI